MRRRQFLRTAGLSGTIGLAGCLGLDGDDTDDEQTASTPEDSDSDSGDSSDNSETDTGDSSEDETEDSRDESESTETSDGDDTSEDDNSSSDGQTIQIDGAWRTFQGDTANTGTGTGSATGPAADPSVAWTVTADDELWGDPVIVDDTVLAGSWDSHLYAVSLSSGEQRWSYETGDALSYPAAVASGTVIIGGGTEVAALDIETGESYWTTTVGSRVRGGAVVEDGTIYVPTQENLTALAASTGDQQWQVRTGGPVASTPHVSDGVVYFTSSDGNIYATDTNGEVVWQQFISSSGGFPSPTVSDGTVFFGWGDGNLYALDAADGSEQWTGTTGGAEVVAASDGRLYIASYPLAAIDIAAQTEHWTTEEPEGIPTNFTVGQDRVYLGTDEAATLAYDRESGEKQWRYQGNYEVTTSVAISDGHLVYSDEFGNIVALS
jgi:outer membrane protein assembly factor BamB